MLRPIYDKHVNKRVTTSLPHGSDVINQTSIEIQTLECLNHTLHVRIIVVLRSHEDEHSCFQVHHTCEMEHWCMVLNDSCHFLSTVDSVGILGRDKTFEFQSPLSRLVSDPAGWIGISRYPRPFENIMVSSCT